METPLKPEFEQERSELSTFFGALIHRAEAIAVLQFIRDTVDPICDFIHIKAFFHAFKFYTCMIFKFLSLKTQKTTPLMFEVSIIHHWHKIQNGLPCHIARWSMFPNMHWTAMHFDPRSFELYFAEYIFVIGSTRFLAILKKHHIIVGLQ